MDHSRCVVISLDDQDHSVASKWTWKNKLELMVFLIHAASFVHVQVLVTCLCRSTGLELPLVATVVYLLCIRWLHSLMLEDLDPQ